MKRADQISWPEKEESRKKRGVNRNWKRFEDRRFVSRLTTSPRLSAHCLAIAVSTVWKFNETGTLNLLICAVLPCRGFHNRTTVGKQAQWGKEILFALDLSLLLFDEWW